MIKVVNRNFDKSQFGIYIGRGSVLGNPFVVGRDGSREEVIAEYRVWLWDKIQKRDKKVLDALKWIIVRERNERGSVIKLSCYCKPKACHGDVIVKAIGWLESQKLCIADCKSCGKCVWCNDDCDNCKLKCCVKYKALCGTVCESKCGECNHKR